MATNRQNLTKKADTLFGKIVRSPGECLRCGTDRYLQCAHGFSRRYRAVRWDLRNAFPLCRGCHLYYTVRPLEWDQWLRDTWGDDLYDELRAVALAGEKVDMESLITSLTETWSGLEAA